MKIFAWAFFVFYSVGLIFSALPIMRFGFLAGLIALLYVSLAQFWVIYSNRLKFCGFFKSSIFHFLPILLITYMTATQLIYYYSNGAAEGRLKATVLSVMVLLVPYIIIWVQYILFKKAYRAEGILAPDEALTP